MTLSQRRKPLSEKAHQCEVFRKGCEAAGIPTPPQTGPAIRDLLKSLRHSPLLLEVRHDQYHHRATPTSKPLIGMAIKAGFAKFIRDERLYAITPEGETWLDALERNGLLGMEVSE